MCPLATFRPVFQVFIILLPRLAQDMFQPEVSVLLDFLHIGPDYSWNILAATHRRTHTIVVSCAIIVVRRASGTDRDGTPPIREAFVRMLYDLSICVFFRV